MSKKPVYIKCPRCSLNYILKKNKYCDICKKEMRAGGYNEDEDMDFDEIIELDLCPVCKTEYLQGAEVMCESCFEQTGGVMPEGSDWDKEDEEEDQDDLDILPPSDDDEETEQLKDTFAKDLDEDFVDKEEEFDESDEVYVDELELDSIDDLDIDDEDEEDEEDVYNDEDEDDDYYI